MDRTALRPARVRIQVEIFEDQLAEFELMCQELSGLSEPRPARDLQSGSSLGEYGRELQGWIARYEIRPIASHSR